MTTASLGGPLTRVCGEGPGGVFDLKARITAQQRCKTFSLRPTPPVLSRGGRPTSC